MGTQRGTPFLQPLPDFGSILANIKTLTRRVTTLEGIEKVEMSRELEAARERCAATASNKAALEAETAQMRSAGAAAKTALGVAGNLILDAQMKMAQNFQVWGGAEVLCKEISTSSNRDVVLTYVVACL